MFALDLANFSPKSLMCHPTLGCPERAGLHCHRAVFDLVLRAMARIQVPDKP